jgi:acid phosphatase (class A)
MMKRSRGLLRIRLAPLLLGLVLAGAPLPAALSTVDHYLLADKIDVLALLPPPPLSGTLEQSNDLAAVRLVHDAAPSNEVAIAQKEDRNPTVFSFMPAAGPFFQAGNLPETDEFFKRVSRDANHFLNIGKTNWQRPRPFQADPSLTPASPASGYSYPSGHAAFGTLNALILAEIFTNSPDQHDAILKLGRDMGWHRVMLADHYPSDVFAGRVVGLAVFRELSASPDFQHDLAEVKAEIAASQPPP